jgi:Putative transposase, YhgA-like
VCKKISGSVLFYHGKETWNPGTLLSQYGPVPENLRRFALRYDFIVVNLQKTTDEEILGMEHAQLLRNIYLAMKHAWEDDFFRKNYAKVFIFAVDTVDEDLCLSLFYSTFLYVQMVSSIKKRK